MLNVYGKKFFFNQSVNVFRTLQILFVNVHVTHKYIFFKINVLFSSGCHGNYTRLLIG